MFLQGLLYTLNTENSFKDNKHDYVFRQSSCSANVLRCCSYSKGTVFAETPCLMYSSLCLLCSNAKHASFQLCLVQAIISQIMFRCDLFPKRGMW